MEKIKYSRGIYSDGVVSCVECGDKERPCGKTIPDWSILEACEKEPESLCGPSISPEALAMAALWGGKRWEIVGFRVYFHDNSALLYPLDMACKKKKSQGLQQSYALVISVLFTELIKQQVAQVWWGVGSKHEFSLYTLKFETWDSPYGPVVKNLPANAGDMYSTPDWGIKIPHAVGQLSLCTTTAWAPTLQQEASTVKKRKKNLI